MLVLIREEGCGRFALKNKTAGGACLDVLYVLVLCEVLSCVCVAVLVVVWWLVVLRKVAVVVVVVDS